MKKDKKWLKETEERYGFNPTVFTRNGVNYVNKKMCYEINVEDFKYLESLNKKGLKDHEAFKNMHTSDGIVGKSTIPSKL